MSARRRCINCIFVRRADDDGYYCGAVEDRPVPDAFFAHECREYVAEPDEDAADDRAADRALNEERERHV